MNATDIKEATAATSETIDEVCQEAVSCYEKRGEGVCRDVQPHEQSDD